MNMNLTIVHPKDKQPEAAQARAAFLQLGVDPDDTLVLETSTPHGYVLVYLFTNNWVQWFTNSNPAESWDEWASRVLSEANAEFRRRAAIEQDDPLEEVIDDEEA